MRRRVGYGLFAAVAVLSTAALGCADEPVTGVTAAGPALKPAALPSAVLPPSIKWFHAADVVVPELTVFAAPGGAVPVTELTNPTREGVPLAFQVLSIDGDWTQVKVPMRPNGTTGWVQTDALAPRQVASRVVVSRSARTLTIYWGDSNTVLFQAPVAIGTSRTPTPVGDFYIDAHVPLSYTGGPYGTRQLSVAGFSDVLRSFGGGVGQIAIHGTNRPELMGQAVSNGCIRMRNDDVDVVAELTGVGTPVTIVD